MAAELVRLTGIRGRAAAFFTVGLLSLLSACGSSPSSTTGPHRSPSPTPPPISSASCRISEPTSLANQAATAPPVPDHGVYVGGFSLAGAPTQDNFVSSLNRLADTACRPLDIAHVYLRWKYGFPSTSAAAFADQGKSLLVSWTGTDTLQMASGADDAEIANTARQIASLGAPVFLEFRWEMDRPNLRRVVHSPADYIAAWDHIRGVFASVGTPNVSWVWCPTAHGFADGTAPAYYPGDDEVDWVCTDAYPLSTPQTTPYQPFSNLVRPFLAWSRSHDKPVMIGEYGVPRIYTPEQRTAWFAGVRSLVTASRRIKALVYFDDDPVDAPLGRSFAIGDDPAVVGAFRQLVNDPAVRLPGAS